MSIRNAMPYLPQAVESILKQSFDDFEFLIVDDHSTDASLGYLKGLSDPRLRLLNHVGQGQTSALNAALREARGPWIARMDGDDWSSPDRLEKQWAATRSQEGVLVSSDYFLCDDQLNPVAEIHLNTRDPGFMAYWQNRQNPFCHPTMMFRRDAALQRGGYDETLVTAQDYALWRSLLKEGCLVHVPEPLLYYRVCRSSVSIARYHEQAASRESILTGAPAKKGDPSTHPDGLYAYRLGFGAWLSGQHWLCVRYMTRSLLRGTRVLRSLAVILLSVLPRAFYLRLTGYNHVYR